MKNKFYILLGIVFSIFISSLGQASIEELSGYFEIRDTIKLMNDEMQRGLDSKNDVSLFDEDDIEFKLESFIGFMENRVKMYAASDSKLKLHYVKKLNELLEETSELYLKARPLINAKREYRLNKNEKVVSPVPYSTIEHPYFNPIDFRTLASREPLDVDHLTIRPLPSNRDNIDVNIEAEKPNKDSVVLYKENNIESKYKQKSISKLEKKVEEKKKDSNANITVINEKKDLNVVSSNNEKTEVLTKTDEKKTSLPSSDTFFIINQPTDETSNKEKVAISSSSKELKADDSNVVQKENDYMRPMAIMVENHNQARPQSGLYKADLVYEIPVEGGITRFMALFTKMPGLIGPVRSCREYFVDRALEVDALYVHCGGSPMGYAYISKSKIRSIDEIKNSPPFFRDKLRKAPHNLYGNGEAIYRYMAKRVNMRVPNKPIPLSYGVREDVGTDSGYYLRINYHGNYTLEIKEENGVYHRYMNNILHLDRETKKPLDISTVILQVASMKVVDSVGRQDISFIGSGKAWIFEKGKRTSVTWHKASPRTKTTYVDGNGKEYLFSDKGQIWIQVVSPAHKIFFEPVKDVVKEVKKTAKPNSKSNKKG